MRLALLYHQFIPRGGLEGYLREFASQLRGAGHELVLVTCRADDTARALADGVRMIPRALTSRGTLAKFAALSAEMVPDLGVDAVLGFGRTWLQDVHRAGGGSHWHYSRMLPWWKRMRAKNQLELALERRLYTGGGTRHFVVNSAKVRMELAEAYQVPEEKVTVIHTAVDAQRWRPAENEAHRRTLRDALGMPDDAPVLLFASLDHRRKGLGGLLPAVAQIPEVRLWVAGQSLDAWRGVIRKYGLESRVTGVGRADLLPYYQAADWFVHPTHYDACANTVLQSMACGLPGFISVNDGAVEFVRRRENGMILEGAGNSDHLAAELKWILRRTESQRLAMGAAARKTVLPLTWNSHLEKWTRLLEQLQGLRPD